MYSIVEIKGHQYWVKPGDIVDVQKMDSEAGKDLVLDQVLFVGGDKPTVGKPIIAGATVKAKVIRHDRGRKQIVFVRKPGKYKKKNGHRQHFTSLLVTEISDGSGQTAKIDTKSKEATKYLK